MNVPKQKLPNVWVIQPMDLANLSLTTEELLLIRNTLRFRKCYAPYGDIVWKPYMVELLSKIEHAYSSIHKDA